MAVPQTANTNDITSVISSLASRQGSRPKPATLPGPKRAAILMLALGEQYGGKIWSLLDDDEVRELSIHMSSLGTVDAGVVEDLLLEFVSRMSASGALMGTFDGTERLLQLYLPPERVAGIMDEIRGPAGRNMWEKLSNVQEEVLANYLKNEYPQTIAVVLGKLRPEHAARVLAILPEDLALDVVNRMLKMEAVQKEVIERVENTLRTEFMSNLSQTRRRDAHEVMAEIFNNFDRQTETRFMTALEDDNRDAAERIKTLMFTFDDLMRLDAGSAQTLMRHIDKEKLAIALEGDRQLFLVDVAHQRLRRAVVELDQVVEGEHQVLDALGALAVGFLERGHEACLGLAVETVEYFRHHLMGVAPAGLRQVGHELGAQRVLDPLDHLLLHRLHLEHAVDDLEREVLRQDGEHARRVLGLELGEHHRDRLRVLVLEIIGENLLLDVGELLPHVAPGRASDLVHDAADAFRRQILMEQPFGRVEVAHDRAGGGEPRHEFEQQALDRRGIDGAERRHGDGELAELLVVEQVPHLAAILLAEREHEHGGPLRPAQDAPLLGRGRLPARQRGDDVLDFVVRLFGGCGHGGLGDLVQPVADDRRGFVGVAFGEFADLLHRLGVDLSLHLGDLDHLGGLARLGLDDLVRDLRHARMVGKLRLGGAHRLVRSDDPAHHRAHHQEQHHVAEQQHDAALDRAHDVVLGELQHPEQARRLVDADYRGLGEAQIDHLDLIAAFLVVADGGAHERGDAVELLLGAVLVDRIALVALGVVAVDQDRDRDAVDAAALDHLGLGHARDVVIDDFIGFLALLARGVVLLRVGARQLVADRHLALIFGGA